MKLAILRKIIEPGLGKKLGIRLIQNTTNANPHSQNILQKNFNNIKCYQHW